MTHEGVREMQVTTWADGFGTWHARVTEYGVGDAEAARWGAREAILGELLSRVAEISPERMGVRQIARTSQYGVLETEYVEMWPDES